jgi:glycosyltransferase involved in cell wall biosynthesis
VEVLTVRYEADWPEIERSPTGLTIRRIPFDDLCRRFPKIRGLGVVNTLFLGLRISRAVEGLANNFDVLHTHNVSGPMSAFAVRSASRAGLRTLAKVVNIGPQFDLRVLDNYFLWGRIARRWLKRDVTRWQAISAAVADDLRRAGIRDDRISMLPNGVCLGDGPKQLPSLASRFLYLGRLAHTAPRDVPGLIEVFAEMIRKRTGSELAIVGEGDRLAEIRGLVASRAGGGQVQVPGLGDGKTWRRWAHCLVQPSFVEGLSNALLEGMASGLACVAYDIPPNREALDNGRAGILVPVSDHRALREALEALAGEPGLARSWGQRARAHAEDRYDMRKVAAQALDVYRTL